MHETSSGIQMVAKEGMRNCSPQKSSKSSSQSNHQSNGRGREWETCEDYYEKPKKLRAGNMSKYFHVSSGSNLPAPCNAEEESGRDTETGSSTSAKSCNKSCVQQRPNSKHKKRGRAICDRGKQFMETMSEINLQMKEKVEFFPERLPEPNRLARAEKWEEEHRKSDSKITRTRNTHPNEERHQGNELKLDDWEIKGISLRPKHLIKKHKESQDRKASRTNAFTPKYFQNPSKSPQVDKFVSQASGKAQYNIISKRQNLSAEKYNETPSMHMGGVADFNNMDSMAFEIQRKADRHSTYLSHEGNIKKQANDAARTKQELPIGYFVLPKYLYCNATQLEKMHLPYQVEKGINVNMAEYEAARQQGTTMRNHAIFVQEHSNAYKAGERPKYEGTTQPFQKDCSSFEIEKHQKQSFEQDQGLPSKFSQRQYNIPEKKGCNNELSPSLRELLDFNIEEIINPNFLDDILKLNNPRGPMESEDLDISTMVDEIMKSPGLGESLHPQTKEEATIKAQKKSIDLPHPIDDGQLKQFYCRNELKNQKKSNGRVQSGTVSTDLDKHILRSSGDLLRCGNDSFEEKQKVGYSNAVPNLDRLDMVSNFNQFDQLNTAKPASGKECSMLVGIYGIGAPDTETGSEIKNDHDLIHQGINIIVPEVVIDGNSMQECDTPTVEGMLCLPAGLPKATPFMASPMSLTCLSPDFGFHILDDGKL